MSGKERRHIWKIWAIQLKLLRIMRGRPDRCGSADDVTPPGEVHTGNAGWLGSAFRQLAERGRIEHDDFVRSTRPSRKGGVIRRWHLCDDRIADKAIAELARLLRSAPPPGSDDADGQATLFD